MIHRGLPLRTEALSLQDKAWLATFDQQFSTANMQLIEDACQLAAAYGDKPTQLKEVTWAQHVMGTVSILMTLHVDAITIMATILYAAPQYIDDWEVLLKSRFGERVTRLVSGVHQLDQVYANHDIQPSNAQSKLEKGQQVERLRKMLLAMVQDIRVVLIKLAERTHTLRAMASAPVEQQTLIAQQVQGIFSPLANRLGIWQLKWELEDLSTRYISPTLYKEIATLLATRRVDREQYIANVENQLTTVLAQAGIQAEVAGRPKHIYSIINKMRRKQLSFDALYDVRAVRILVKDIDSCYAALDVVQQLWQPIPGEFDDYIARPKSNHYQSIHTAVVGPEGLAVEVQIRTFDMHHHSELGVAAHWRYKEGKQADAALDHKISWLRQILAWHDADDVGDKTDLLTQYQTELFQENVYVFTPEGDVIDLPKGATPIDFAYSLHTGLGHRTRGAKVDGHIVPLKYSLQNAQRVEILTNKHGAPSLDWLNPNQGYLKTASARAKVRHWFKQQNIEAYITQGRTKLERELHRHAADSINHEKLANKLHFNKLEALLAAIGRGEITEHQLGLAIHALLKPNAQQIFQQEAAKRVFNPLASAVVIVEELGNLQTNMAKCCKPQASDAIIAYVTRSRGVTIHKQTCTFIHRLVPERHDRLLSAHWSQS